MTATSTQLEGLCCASLVHIRIRRAQLKGGSVRNNWVAGYEDGGYVHLAQSMVGLRAFVNTVMNV